MLIGLKLNKPIIQGYIDDMVGQMTQSKYRGIPLMVTKDYLLYFYICGNIEVMDISTAILQLSSIAQEARLQIFRLLVQAGEVGLSAGGISETLQVPASTLSFHLKALNHAGLIHARQESRFIYYSANYAAMNDLLAYLTQNCCVGGATEACITDVACCH